MTWKRLGTTVLIDFSKTEVRSVVKGEGSSLCLGQFQNVIIIMKTVDNCAALVEPVAHHVCMCKQKLLLVSLSLSLVMFVL